MIRRRHSLVGRPELRLGPQKTRLVILVERFRSRLLRGLAALLRRIGDVADVAAARGPIDVGPVERERHGVWLVAGNDDGARRYAAVERRGRALLDVPEG